MTMKLTAKERKTIAASVPDNAREHESQMLDRILRDYWQMVKPSKLQLLWEYQDRCDSDLSPEWLQSHCVFAEYAETIIV